MTRGGRIAAWLGGGAAIVVVGLLVGRWPVAGVRTDAAPRGEPGRPVPLRRSENPAANTSDPAQSRGKVGTAAPAAPTRELPERRWQRTLTLPVSVERDAELADILQEVAEADPDLAARLLLSVGTAERQRIVTAALIDSARKPDQASRIATELVREDPSGSADHGFSLVTALTRAKEFEAALTFIERENASGRVGDEDPAKWLRALFAEWARQDATGARAAADRLAMDSWRAEARAEIERSAPAWR